MSSAILGSGMVLALTACGADRAPPPSPDADPTNFWKRRLSEVVRDGTVDLEALRADRTALDQYVGWNALHGPETDKWRLTDDDRRLAWYLNTFNALTLWTALDGVEGDPYPNVRVRLDGEVVALDSIPNVVLSTYEEPTSIAGLFCFATGCPPMRAALYEKKGLDAALAGQMKAWVNGGLVRMDGSTAVFSVLLKPWVDEFHRWGDADGPCAIAAPYADDPLKAALSVEGSCPVRWE